MLISRYLAREVVLTLLAVLAIFLLIFLGRHFARYLAESAAGDLPAELILQLLALLTVSALVLIIPFAFFIAVLVSLGRLYRDNEMTALAAAGVGAGGILRPVLVLAAICTALVGWLSWSAAPWAAEQSARIRAQGEAQSDLASVGAGQFREVGTGRSVFYAEGLSNNGALMNRVFLRHVSPGGVTSVFAAETGYQFVDAASGERYLVLLNGDRYEGTPGTPGFRIHQYAKTSIHVPSKEVQPRARKRDATPSAELWGSDHPRDAAEIQHRLSMPLSVLLLGVLAVFMSRTSPREGRYARLFGAILVYVIYTNLLGTAQSWVQREIVPPAPGMWWVHLLLAATIAFIVVRYYGARYLFSRGGRTA